MRIVTSLITASRLLAYTTRTYPRVSLKCQGCIEKQYSLTVLSTAERTEGLFLTPYGSVYFATCARDDRMQVVGQ